MSVSVEQLNERLKTLEMQVQVLQKELQNAYKQIDQVDDWAKGIFELLQDVLMPLLRVNPELRKALGDTWRNAQQDYDEALAKDERPEHFEPRKMMANIMRTVGLLGDVATNHLPPDELQ